MYHDGQGVPQDYKEAVKWYRLAAERLERYFSAAVELMTVLARVAGHRHQSDFTISDLTTYNTDIAQLAGIAYGGVGWPDRQNDG